MTNPFPDDAQVSKQLTRLEDPMLVQATPVVLMQLTHLARKNIGPEVKLRLGGLVINRFVMNIERGFGGRGALRNIFEDIVQSVTPDWTSSVSVRTAARNFHAHCAGVCQELSQENPVLIQEMTPIVRAINRLGRRVGGEPLRFGYQAPARPAPKGGPGHGGQPTRQRPVLRLVSKEAKPE